MKNRKNGRATPPALVALRRAAKEALELARRTGTPCHVEKDGKIFDIAKTQPAAGKRSRSRTKRR